jgi:hypothetical protein
MADPDTIPPTSDRAHLARLVVDLLRLVKTLRAEYRACSELLSLTLGMLREREIEIDRVRERYHALLDERRAERRQRPATPERPAA